jgi:predicted acyl esterase
VVGPWNHGGWSRGAGDRLGPITFDSATAKYFREQIQAPWFAYWLKGIGKLDLPEATTFEAGSNTWRKWDSWPVRANASAKRLYFHADHQLSFSPPTDQGTDAVDAYTSDPANPVPYRERRSARPGAAARRGRVGSWMISVFSGPSRRGQLAIRCADRRRGDRG